MKKRILSILFCGLLAVPALAAKGPTINLIDNKLSIDAETVPLSRLLRLLDMATGLKSKVPPELANRNISVKFSGLDLTEGVRKIFPGRKPCRPTTPDLRNRNSRLCRNFNSNSRCRRGGSSLEFNNNNCNNNN